MFLIDVVSYLTEASIFVTIHYRDGVLAVKDQKHHRHLRYTQSYGLANHTAFEAHDNCYY